MLKRIIIQVAHNICLHVNQESFHLSILLLFSQNMFDNSNVSWIQQSLAGEWNGQEIVVATSISSNHRVE